MKFQLPFLPFQHHFFHEILTPTVNKRKTRLVEIGTVPAKKSKPANVAELEEKMADSTCAKVTGPTLYKINSTLASLGSLLDAWIIAIERLDRKLSDAIGPNIRENVTSHYRERFNRCFVSLIFHHTFHISVLDCTDCLCF